jgi:hypothetical protein
MFSIEYLSEDIESLILSDVLLVCYVTYSLFPRYYQSMCFHQVVDSIEFSCMYSWKLYSEQAGSCYNFCFIIWS